MNTREQIANAARSTAPAPKVEAPEGKPAPAPKVKAEPKPCGCQVPGDNGCNGGKTARFFAPGHDAKLVGHLTREVVAGNLTKEQATEVLAQRSGGSKTLLGKLTTAIPRELAKKANQDKRESDRAKAKAEKAAKDATVKEQVAAVKADREAAQAASA